MITRALVPFSSATLCASCITKVPEVLRCEPSVHGDTRRVTVQSRAHWNETCISLKKGRTYQFTSTGTWTDWFMKCDADGPLPGWKRGFMSRFADRLRFSPATDPKAHYFSLIGCIGRGDGTTLPQHSFLIGGQAILKAPASGILHVFANDDRNAYWNNYGSIELAVSEQSIQSRRLPDPDARRRQ